jgi:hypothetical protein
MGLESGEIDKTGATTTNASSIPTGYKLIIKAVVILMTLGGFSLGIGTLVTVNPLCIVAGVLLMYQIKNIYLIYLVFMNYKFSNRLEGVLIFIFELPILFNCIRCLEPLIRFSEGRAGWQKAFIYIV